MKLFFSCIVLISLVWIANFKPLENQSKPCFIGGNAWQFYTYRDCNKETEFIRPFFSRARVDSEKRVEMILKFDLNSNDSTGFIKGHSLVSVWLDSPPNRGATNIYFFYTFVFG